MYDDKITITPDPNFINAALRDTVPRWMSLAALICSAIGTIMMAILGFYLLMAIYIAIFIATFLCGLLVLYKKITVNTACLIPMLLLLFAYTPASWFTFDGLMGCTPYLTILFMALTTMTYYRKLHIYLLILYGATIAGLLIYWVAALMEDHTPVAVVNTLAAYVITTVLILLFILNFQKKSREVGGIIMEESVRDQLTGLYNRRIIDNVIFACEKKYRSDIHDYSVLMLDINSFKKINDEYGHQEGDSVLVDVAACIKNSIRSSDFALRYGGDEYLIILPGAKYEAVQWISCRIESYAKEIFTHRMPISLSMGYSLRSECASADEMIRVADRRMYEAKSKADG